METKVVNIKKYDGDYIFIGRGSMYGNPFKIPVHGNREEVIKLYEMYLRNNVVLMKDIERLRGETLGCYCKPKPCHGDIIVKILEERKKNE